LLIAYRPDRIRLAISRNHSQRADARRRLDQLFLRLSVDLPCPENVRVKRIKGVDATLKTMFVFARALPDGSETLLIETGSAALTAKSFISSKLAGFRS